MDKASEGDLSRPPAEQRGGEPHQGREAKSGLVWVQWRNNRYLGTIVSVLILLGLWQVAALSNPLFVPSAWPTLRSMVELTIDGPLIEYSRVTLYRILIGWVIGVALGIPVGWLIAQSDTFKRIVDPYINFFRFIPPIIWVTVFLIWFGYNDLTRFMLVAYATFMICVIHGTVGMITIPPEKIRAAQNLGVKGWELFRRVKIPASLPEVFTGMRVAMTNSFMTIIAVEMLTASSGIGYLAWTSRLYMRLDYVFASIIVLGFMGLLTDLVFKVISRKYFRRFGVAFE